jgi:arginase
VTDPRLVRVPRAWGAGGEAMVGAAFHDLPYDEAAVVEADTLEEQTHRVAAELPELPVVLGGCCCSHVGAIQALSERVGRLAVVWVDAHGDLNTPATSPSGNAWGMPLRMAIDRGAVEPRHVALVGARNLDPPEVEFIESAGVQVGESAVGRALEGADAVYVAFDADAVEPGELAVFMPEPNGLLLDDAEMLLRDVALRARVVGLGFTGLVRDPANEPKLARLGAALSLSGPRL